MKERNELKELYEKAIQVDPNAALRQMQAAETEEERKFYAFLVDMQLQRAQKKVIEQKLF